MAVVTETGRRRKWVTQSLVVIVGGAIAWAALLADDRWVDRHFLPMFFLARPTFLNLVVAARVLLLGAGVWLALIARPVLARRWASVPLGELAGRWLRILLSIALSLATTELVLRTLYRRAAQESSADEEPRRRRDPLYGWSFVPGRTGHDLIGGRSIEYAFDTAGYRVAKSDRPVDPARPSIVFTGESCVVGYKLNWQESLPAQVQASTGVQAANLAVNGFANDQAYRRLEAELPRFARPLAVVGFFMPAIFDRNLDTDRPHMGPGMIWQPAERPSRLAMIARGLVPYRSSAEVELGVQLTRSVLQATVALARSRGAQALFVVPRFGAETAQEQWLRQRILDDGNVPYVLVELDPSWRVPHDAHPDARAAAAMARAVVDRLEFAQ